MPHRPTQFHPTIIKPYYKKNRVKLSMAFMIAKEKANFKLAKQLQKEGYIITPRAPFQVSNKQEINGLIARGVFKFKKYDPIKFNGVCIFKSRIVNKIKGKATNALFKKLRLII